MNIVLVFCFDILFGEFFAILNKISVVEMTSLWSIFNKRTRWTFLLDFDLYEKVTIRSSINNAGELISPRLFRLNYHSNIYSVLAISTKTAFYLENSIDISLVLYCVDNMIWLRYLQQMNSAIFLAESVIKP